MKNVIKGLVLLSSIVSSINIAYADWIQPLIGVDYEWSKMRGSNSWRSILPKSYTGGDIYIGAQFSEYVGVELGYQSTTKKTRKHAFKAQDQFFDISVPADSTSKVNVRFHGWYFDLLGYLPFDNCFGLIGTVGYGVIRPKVVGMDSIAFLNTLGGGSIHGRTVGGFRLGAGGQYMLTDFVGIRALARWKNTAHLKFKSNSTFAPIAQQFRISRRLFKDTGSLLVGIFVKF